MASATFYVHGSPHSTTLQLVWLSFYIIMELLRHALPIATILWLFYLNRRIRRLESEVLGTDSQTKNPS